MRQELTHQMGLRIERDTMMHQRMLLEELLEYHVVILGFLVQRQIDLRNLDVGEVVAHIVTETGLAVLLLLRGHIPVAHLLHNHDFLLFRCNEHQHPGSKVATLERILSEERQRTQIGHIRIEQDKGYLLGMQLVGEVACQLKGRRNDDDTCRLTFQTIGSCLFKGFQIKPFIIYELNRDTKVSTMVTGSETSFLDLLPVSLRFMLRQQTIKSVGFVVCQGRGIHIWTIVHFLESLVYLLQRLLRHIGTIVEHTVHRTHRDTGSFCDIFYSYYLFSHDTFLRMMQR